MFLFFLRSKPYNTLLFFWWKFPFRFSFLASRNTRTQLVGHFPNEVLVLNPPTCFTLLESISSHKFQYLKAWDSDLPLEQFLTSHASSIRALVTPSNGPAISEKILRLLPSLGLVVTASVGLDHIDLSECQRRGVAVANARNLFSEDVADMAVGLLLDVVRKISASDQFVRQGLWPTSGDYPLRSKVSTISSYMKMPVLHV